MTAISVVSEGQPAKVLANPVHITSRRNDHIEFEVLEANAGGLRKVAGTTQLLAIEGVAIFGTLESLESCASTAKGLAMLRTKATLKGVIRTYPESHSGVQ